MRPYLTLTDEELVAEIQAYIDARRKVAMGDIAVIAGEGRRTEFAPGNSRAIDENLRMLEYEARVRGLPIAGEGGAISVEFR